MNFLWLNILLQEQKTDWAVTKKSKDVISLAIMARKMLFWSYFLPVEIIPLIKKKAHETWEADEIYWIQGNSRVPRTFGAAQKSSKQQEGDCPGELPEYWEPASMMQLFNSSPILGFLVMHLPLSHSRSCE